MRQTFVVGVDSGAIQIATDPERLEKAGAFYAGIQDLTGWSADSVWDGKLGGISTPAGDGPHTIIYDPGQKRDWKGTREHQSIALVNRSPRFDEPAKRLTIYFGDVGRPDGAIKFPPHHYLGGVWLDEYTLQLFTE